MGEIMHDIFGPGSNPEKRIFRDIDQLMEKIKPCKTLGMKVSLTSGTFDLFHVGHSRYLEQAKKRGDILIVGVDSDEKVREKKGIHRPIVDENERMEILCHCRYVDLIYLKKADDPRWHLIKTVRPDFLIVSEREYCEKDLDGLREFCGEVVFLPSQAISSTTAKIRAILIEPAKQIEERLRSVVDETCAFLSELTDTKTRKG